MFFPLPEEPLTRYLPIQRAAGAKNMSLKSQMPQPDFSLTHPVLSPSEPFTAQQQNLPHILLILDQFPRSLGGGERIVLRLAALLPAEGFRVSILTFQIHPESPVRALAPPCPIYLLPLEKTYGRNAMRAGWSLGRFLRRNDIRLVETFFESSDLWGGTVVRLLSRARLVWSRRDMGILRERKHQVAYRLLASLPHRVFAVSEQVRRHVIDVDHVDPKRVTVVYNGLDLTPQTPNGTAAALEQGIQPVTFRIVTLGNIRRVKGHDLFLTAAVTILKRFPNTSFWVAGEVLEADFFAELQQQLLASSLLDRFHFVHGVHNVEEFLQDADVFVLPSRSEGFSNAILEAMAAGLPVVATDVGGNAEAVEDQKTGIIVPSDDAASLALAVIEILSDPSRRQAMTQAGLKRVASRFTSKAMMNVVSEAFRELLGRS